jgi:hypothetical protein
MVCALASKAGFVGECVFERPYGTTPSNGRQDKLQLKLILMVEGHATEQGHIFHGVRARVRYGRVGK